MKKVLMSGTLLVCMVMLSGCGSKTLTCTDEVTSDGMGTTTTKVELTFKKDKISKAKTSATMVVEDAYKSYISFMKSSLESTLENQNGVTYKVTVNDNKLDAVAEYNISKLDSDTTISGANQSLSYDDAKKYFEDSGYTCK